MTQIFELNADRPGEYDDIHLFRGEGLHLSVLNRSTTTDIVFTVAADAFADLLVDVAFRADSWTLTASDLAVLPEGQRLVYNVWKREDGALSLLSRGVFLAHESLEPASGGTLLSLTGTPSGPMTEGVDFTFQPVLSGGQAPVAFDIAEGTLPPGLTLDPVSGLISGRPTQEGSWPGIVLRVTDANAVTASQPLVLNVAAATPGIAMVWRWGQSNEGTLGNSPAGLAPAQRGAFPGIRQLDSLGNTLGPDEVYDLVPYAILDTGETAVIGEDTITGPQGTKTAIADGIPVGPTLGLAIEIRDNDLFASALETWFCLASAPGKPLSYFLPAGEVPAHASGDPDASQGWQHKCYANRHLRAVLAAAGGPVYLQMTGDAQGEADTAIANAGAGASDPYVTHYMAHHAVIRQADADVLGVTPPHFKIQLLPVWNATTDTRDEAVDALNAAIAQASRYHVSLSGEITDTGAGDPGLYYVCHNWTRQVDAWLGDPHFTATEQVALGQAMAAAQKVIHGTDGVSAMHRITRIRPQLVGSAVAVSSRILTVTGFVSDPGTVCAALVPAGAAAPTRDQIVEGEGGAIVAAASAQVTSHIAGAAASLDILAPAHATDYDLHVLLRIESGETSVLRAHAVTTGTVVRSFDSSLYPGDVVYSNGDMTATHDATGSHHVRAVPNSEGGRRYYEATAGGASGPLFVGVGLTTSPAGGGDYGVDKAGWAGSVIQFGGTNIAMGNAVQAADVVQVAWDGDAGTLWLRSNGSGDWNNTPGADPASGVGGADISGLDHTLIVPMVGLGPDDDVTLALDAADWQYAPPAGFGEIG